MLIVGLTGPTGAGKSLVSAMLSEWYGVVIVDCDQLARRVAQKGNLCLIDLAVEFTPSIIDATGNLNRKKLADIVFQNKGKLKRLNEIIFPYILEEAKNDIKKAKKEGARLVVLDAPTLFDSKADTLCDKIVVVLAEPYTRIQRVIDRDNVPANKIVQRMANQGDDKFFIDRANHIIINDGDTVTLRLAVLELLNNLGM